MVNINTLLIFALIIVIVVACYAFYKVYKLSKAQQNQNTAAPSGPVDPFATTDTDALRGDPRKLKAGDIVDIFGETFSVRGSLRLTEGGYHWSEHFLDTGSNTRKWLSVEEDPELELVLWTEAADVPDPGPAELQHAGKQFRLEESGQAQFTSEATTGLAPQGTVRYHDYVASDGTQLAYEDFGAGRHEGALGQVLTRSAIMIYPQQPS